MDQILKLLVARAQGSYYFEDVQALQARSIAEADRWTATPLTPGFRRVREVAEAASVGVVLEEGGIAWGDCVSVSYGGKSGRDPLLRFSEAKTQIESVVGPALRGKSARSFRELSASVARLPISQAVKYGLTQALLRAAAQIRRVTEADVILDEWSLPNIIRPIALQGSSGNDRRDNADKMIVNRLEALPHTQVDSIPEQLGLDGSVLIAYAKWLRRRIGELGAPDYAPTIHLDVHGAVAKIFNHDVDRVAGYLGELAQSVAPFALRMESVAILPNRDEQCRWHAELREKLAKEKIPVPLIMDEWANRLEDIDYFARSGSVDGIHIKMPDVGPLCDAIEAVLACRKQGVFALLGGSCIETDISARLSVHVAMATRPDALLVKPGMGVNEGIAICRNEMNRILATWGAPA